MTTQDVASALVELFDDASDDVRQRAGHSPAWRTTAADGTRRADPIRELVYSMLLWNGSAKQADAALERIDDELVDFNELRVCVPHELRAIVGCADEDAGEERSVRLRLALHDIASREQALSLDHLAELPKRDARSYLEAIDGLPRFASARVALVCFGVHAVPVDARLAARLTKAGVLPKGSDEDDAAAKLERAVRASHALETYLTLERWAAATGRGSRAPKARAAAGATAGRKR